MRGRGFAALIAAFFSFSAGAQTAPAGPQVPLVSVDGMCVRLGARLPGTGTRDCDAAELRPAATTSVQGLPILLRDFAPRTPRARKPPRILLVGGIHGDELTSTSIVFEWMQHLARARFQPFAWRVVPCLNPDGMLGTSARRVNANGVDLNRNFHTPDWSLQALPYWKRETASDPRRYPGPRPFSEPEARWLAAEIRRYQPDAVVQVHAPFGLLDYDGPRRPPAQLGFLHLRLLGVYPGSLGNYAGLFLKLPVLTLELPNSLEMPRPGEVDRVWADLLSWLDDHLAEHTPLEAAPPLPSPNAIAPPWITVLRGIGDFSDSPP